ncbi:hypothetical protein [Actinoallomurus iriomotensis]|uniref:Lipoprotein n=1 Tax=Actinoallomurus iriomotensis TaxID=478107 RepID=A0A9W6RSS3_9ACTN|nr:hypothetical protein [Actinoallomurus iriomotensis]GLY81866.1 hypothetical protein Airi01_101330 [Actinoallomurus iriomotensis]
MSRAKAHTRVGATLAVTVFALAGCGGDRPGEPDGQPTAPHTNIDNGQGLTVVHVKVDGGRLVTCVIYDGTNRGGLSCDWSAR